MEIHIIAVYLLNQNMKNIEIYCKCSVDGE